MSKLKKVMNYPDPFATNDVKSSKEYGLEYARFIEHEWITNGELATRKSRFEELEAYKNNTVNTSKFKNMLDIKDKAYVAMNWEMTSIVPKFVNVVKDSLPVDMFRVQARGVDVMSQEERKKYRENLETEMLTADFSEQMSIATGINFRPEYVPESREELDLHMELEYRQKKEIAAELIINRVFDLNYYREIQNQVIEDIVTYGMGALKVDTDPLYGVVLKHVDCKYLLHSYDPTKTRDKKGCYYFGEVSQMNVSDIYRKSRGEVPKELLRNPSPDRRFRDEAQDPDDDTTFSVLYFTFKTSMDEVYKRKRNNLIDKDMDFKLPEQSSSRVIKGT